MWWVKLFKHWKLLKKNKKGVYLFFEKVYSLNKKTIKYLEIKWNNKPDCRNQKKNKKLKLNKVK